MFGFRVFIFYTETHISQTKHNPYWAFLLSSVCYKSFCVALSQRSQDRSLMTHLVLWDFQSVAVIIGTGSLKKLHLIEHLSRCDSDSRSLRLLLSLLADAGVTASRSLGIWGDQESKGSQSHMTVCILYTVYFQYPHIQEPFIHVPVKSVKSKLF